ncbi:RICIN domain-containing protein [Streptomyces sp. NPDC056160]|uniref:RICIN domain-containing protein n=1 Tax=Streptomyces sp. NPDC056160 TaxID=3345731 RepID=UPI0035DC1B08
MRRLATAAVLAGSVLAVGLLPATASAQQTMSASVNKCAQKVTFRNSQTGYYLDASGGGGAGTKVITWNRNGGSNQRWCLEKAKEGGWYFHPSYNLNLCMDSPNASDDRPVIWRCKGNSNQRFNVYGTSVYGGKYFIQLRRNGRYVTEDGRGGQVVMAYRLSDFHRASLWK